MKLNIILLILVIFITLSNCDKLVPKQVQSKKFEVFYNNWYDLMEQEIKCPNDGVIKNFVLRKNGNTYYYDLQCYSSENEDVDYGEPIIKNATYHATYDKIIYRGAKIDINTLGTFDMDCTPEYGLNGFIITMEKEQFTGNQKLIGKNFCKPTKSSYVSKKNLKTQEKTSAFDKLDCFVDILVGSTETENEDVVGYPLRSFAFKIEPNGKTQKCYYLYSYSKLKNMGKFKDERHRQFAELRNKNTQVD